MLTTDDMHAIKRSSYKMTRMDKNKIKWKEVRIYKKRCKIEK